MLGARELVEDGRSPLSNSKPGNGIGASTEQTGRRIRIAPELPYLRRHAVRCADDVASATDLVIAHKAWLDRFREGVGASAPVPATRISALNRYSERWLGTVT